MGKHKGSRPNFEADEHLYFRPRGEESEEEFAKRFKEVVLAAISEYKREHPEEAADDRLDPEHAEAYLRGLARLERIRQGGDEAGKGS